MEFSNNMSLSTVKSMNIATDVSSPDRALHSDVNDSITGLSKVFISEMIKPIMEDMVKNISSDISITEDLELFFLQEHFTDLLSQNGKISEQVSRYVKAQFNVNEG